MMDRHKLQPQHRGFAKISVSNTLKQALEDRQRLAGLPSIAAVIKEALDTSALDRHEAKRRLRKLHMTDEQLSAVLDALFSG